MSNPFSYNRKRFWLVFPNGHVGFWGFKTRERAEFFTSGKTQQVIEAPNREKAQEVANG